MPKNKKEASSSSDSDEGPIDRDPPASKKAKTSAGNNASSGNKAEGSEQSWVLEGKKMVKLRVYKGKTYVDIREYYEKNGEMLPGKKGVSLTPHVWRKLLSLSEEINEKMSAM